MRSSVKQVPLSTFRKVSLAVAATAFMTTLLSLTSTAQTGGASPQLQEKLGALKQSAAQNQQKLHQYQWTEIQQVTYKGEDKPAKTSFANTVLTASPEDPDDAAAATAGSRGTAEATHRREED